MVFGCWAGALDIISGDVLTDFEPKSIFIRFYFNNGLYKEEGERDQLIALIEINEIKSTFNY